MKQYVFLALALLITFGAVAQTTKVNGPVITFDKKTHDFGDIQQGDRVEHTFYFTNTGNEPLLITNVQVSCGCTTPKGWPRDPIPPGAKGQLTVAFDSTGKMGKQSKPVTIISNAVNPEGTQVTFTTNVLEKRPQ